MKTFMLNIKKTAVITCIIIFVSIFVSCTAPKDKVLTSLGQYEKSVFFTSGGFQDYTDYAKYYYTSAKVTENKYFKKIRETDLDLIAEYTDNFEKWIETIKETDASDEVVVNYDFNREIIGTDDYIYINSAEYTNSDGITALASYDIYFFDTKTQVLYYLHNNI